MLTGNLTPLVWGMAERLLRDQHELTFLGHVPDFTPPAQHGTYRDYEPDSEEAAEVIRAGQFDEIVFFFSYAGEALSQTPHGGRDLDALAMMLRIAAETDVQRFILITDLRVFGADQLMLETTEPVPDTLMGIQIKAAENTLALFERHPMKTLLVRVSHLYLPKASDSFFSRVVESAMYGKTLTMAGVADMPIDFLHVDDLAQFIALTLSRPLQGTVHLAYRGGMTAQKLVSLIKDSLPDLKVVYAPEAARLSTLQTGRAKSEADWVPRHRISHDLPDLIAWQKTHVRRRGFLSRLSDAIRQAFGRALPYVELIVFALLADTLTRITQIYTAFRFVDFWLFYVILMGTSHGAIFGTLAAIIAVLFYALAWILSGKDASLLLYEMDHWLPFAMYLLGGALFGYMRDQMVARRDMAEREKGVLQEEAAFLESLYRQAFEERNQLQKQVLRTRDSYGRIYAVTKELDALQPEQVLLSTVHVIEDLLQNRSVAIYSHAGHSPYVRLTVQSPAIKDSLEKSIELDAFPELKEKMIAGQVFVNRQLDRKCPVYCAPIRGDNQLLGMIALWDVPFDQQNAYYENLFSVICGLVQASMVRAVRHLNMAPDMFLPNTRILTETAFRNALTTYEKMRRQNSTEYILLRLHPVSGSIDAMQFNELVGKAARTTDIVGELADGVYLALLPQAVRADLPRVLARFEEAGLTGEVVAAENYLDV